MYSANANLKMQFVKDPKYEECILTGWYKKHKGEEYLLDIKEDGIFTLCQDVFSKEGSIYFSFALNRTDGEILLALSKAESLALSACCAELEAEFLALSAPPIYSSQGAENAGKTMVVDADGNIVPGSALPDNVYTQDEVDYLLRDKMDKPYVDIVISDDTTIELSCLYLC